MSCNNVDSSDAWKRYTYYAFISYQHTDEKWAGWLQNKLETYKLPCVLQKERRDMPRRITPIFRDKTDITSGPLKKTLSQELEASRYLIVICSPRSAKSGYVNYEVEQFLRMGRQDRIIPLIIDGEVGAGDTDKECYVPALLYAEESILGVNLPKLGRRKAFLAVVAALLNLKLDILLGRDRLRQRKKRLVIAAAAAVILVSGIRIWDYYLPKTDYYSDYVLKWGLPEGLFPLDKGFLFFGRDDTESMEGYYKITEVKASKTITLKHVNSAGIPVGYPANTEQTDRPISAEYDYKITDGTKRAAEARYMDGRNEVQLILKYSDDTRIVDFTGSDGANSPITLSSSLFSENGMIDLGNTGAVSYSAITRYIHEYNKEGYVISVKFMRDNRASAPTPDRNGITGYVCEVDSFGRTVRKDVIYDTGHAFRYGSFDRIRYEYAESHAGLAAVTYTDESNRPVLNPEGYSVKKFRYDKNGGLRSIAYYDNRLQPVSGPQGYAQITMEYDGRGFLWQEAYYDVNNKPVTAEFGYARILYARDKNGNPTQARVYNPDGFPVTAMPKDIQKYISGYSILRMEYDQSNLLTRQSYYNSDGEPVLCGMGYAAMAYVYDDKGRIKEASYYDSEGRPMKNMYGFEKFTKTYNEAGLTTEWRYLDSNGTLINNAWGYAVTVCEYDSNRNIRTLSYYNAAGKPVLTVNRAARQEYEWDDRGVMTASRNYDTEGKLINSAAGYAEYKYSYREEETQTVNEYAYYDTAGNLAIPAGQEWAKHNIEYSREGLLICDCFYDDNNELTVCGAAGYAKASYTYDRWNKLRSISFYGADMKPYISPLYGFATMELIYQANDLPEANYYDEQGIPMELPPGQSLG